MCTHRIQYFCIAWFLCAAVFQSAPAAESPRKAPHSFEDTIRELWKNPPHGENLEGRNTLENFRRTHGGLKSPMLIDGRNLFFVQPDGSLTMIDIPEGKVVRRSRINPKESLSAGLSATEIANYILFDHFRYYAASIRTFTGVTLALIPLFGVGMLIRALAKGYQAFYLRD